MTTVNEQIYLPALRSKGFDVMLLPTGDRFAVEPGDQITPKLRDRIRNYKNEILAELLVESNAESTTKSTVANQPKRYAVSQYADSRHNCEIAYHGWVTLLHAATDQQITVWMPPDAQPTTRPYCTLRSVLVDAVDGKGGRYIYLPILFDIDNQDYVWAIDRYAVVENDAWMGAGRLP